MEKPCLIVIILVETQHFVHGFRFVCFILNNYAPIPLRIAFYDIMRLERPFSTEASKVFNV